MTNSNTSNITIPSSPSDLKAIKDGIDEMVNCMIRMDSEKDKMKDTLDTLSEKYEIDKKYLRQMAKDSYKDEFDKRASEQDDYEQLYESVINS